MADSSLFSIGSSGLAAFQRSLSTISHNIANVNTEGYSKQSVELVTRTPQLNGYGFTGSGVEIATIERSFDSFIESNLRNATSSASEFEAFHTLAAQLDDVLADPAFGMSSSIQRFFDAVQDVADAPTSSATREVMLAETKNLSHQFNEMAGWLDSIRNQVNNNIRRDVEEVNQITESIALLNSRIVVEQARAGSQPVNDLLDQRDMLIRDLSELVSINTIEQNDGAINVMTGTGQVLVVGNNVTQMTVYNEPNDPSQLGVALNASGGLLPITNQVSGGTLGGTLSFRDRMLDSAMNDLGRVAISVGHFMNEQQNQGMDLDGQLGIDMFDVKQPDVITYIGTPGTVVATFDDVSQLTNLDYTMQFNAGSWQLTRNDTGQAVTMTGTGTAADPFIVDGLSIEITAPAANGDTFQVRPTRNGAMDMDVLLSNNRQIAAATPVRTNTALSNTGLGEVSAGVVTDINNAAFQTTSGQLTPPVLIRFTATNSYDVYDNTNPASPVLMEAGIVYDPLTGSDVFPTPGGIDHGYSFSISGTPAAGDEFSTEYNTGGIGDNRNALLMANVANMRVMEGGRTTINEGYSNLISSVATHTRQSELNMDAQQGVLRNVSATRESISGVNLDEEAANLVRYQQAYQAAAQVITVANTLFDTLLNTARR